MIRRNYKWLIIWTLITSIAGVFSLVIPKLLNLNIQLTQDRLLNQVVCGLLLSGLQSFALRFLTEKTYYWIILTLAAYIVNTFTFGLFDGPYLSLATSNFFISSFQSLYLYGKVGKIAFIWIPVFSISVFIAPFLISSIGSLIYSYLLASGISFAVVSFFMGVFLIKMFEGHKKQVDL